MIAPLAYSAAVDARSGDHTQTVPLTSSLTTASDGSPELDLNATMAFLSDPATLYPVMIDPTISSVSQFGDTYVTEQNTTDHSSDYDLRIGLSTLGNRRRSLVRFNAGSVLAGMHVTSATLSLYDIFTGSCTPSPVFAYPVSSAYTMSTVTWATQPTIDTTPAFTGTGTFAYGNEPTCANGAGTLDVTNMVQGWASGALADNGLELRDAETVEATEKRFCAMNVDTTATSACTSASLYPTLSVTYNSIPGVPAGVAYSPHVTGTQGTQFTTSLTPSISSTATNADGSPFQLEAMVQHSTAFPAEGTGQVWDGLSASATAGGTATVTVPAGVLLAGKHYQYQVRAVVASGASGTDHSAWTALAPMAVNVNAPAAPGISCAAYLSNKYTAQTPSGDTCTLTTTAGDGSGYYWALDDPNPSTLIVDATNSSAAKTFTITPGTGWHTLYAVTRDTAYHLSTKTSYSFGVGVGAVTSPATHGQTAKAVALSSSTSSTYTKVTYQWSPGATSTTWTNLPVADVTPAGSSTPITAWPLTGTVAGSLTTFTGYNWDVASTLAAASQPDGALRIRAIFTTAAGASSTSDAVVFSLNRAVFSSTAPTADLGPGTVSLLSGDFAVEAPDISIGMLGISRTATSLVPAAATSDATGVFGAGWRAGLKSVGHAEALLLDNSTNGSMTLRSPDGTESSYVKQADGTYVGLDAANDGSVLTMSTTIKNPADPTDTTVYTGWQLKDLDGTVTTWLLKGGTWVSAWVDGTGTQAETSIARDTNGRVSALLAPSPAGVGCTTANFKTTAGCQGLTLTYATTTTATGTTEATWGNFIGYVSSISWTGYDQNAASPAMVTTQVEAYSYDSTGHLRAVWDPRVSPALKTRYSYDAAGRLASVQAPGRNAQNLNYDIAGKLASVSWTDPVNGPATQAVAYNLPVSGVSGAPDVSGAAAAVWGQTSDQAFVGGAVFPPSHLPALGVGGAYAPTAAQWPFAAITYADVNGQTVNKAAYGAGAWQIDATRYDADGNEVWALTAGNRAQAVSPDSSTDPVVRGQQSVGARANLLATLNTYSADGIDLLTTTGPVHQATLSNGQVASVRIRTAYAYDEGAPTATAYHLLTSTTVSPIAIDGTTVPATDLAIVRNGYDPIDGSLTTGPTSGWTLAVPTTVTHQMGSSPAAADLVTRNQYNASGDVVLQRRPGGAATDANSVVTTYYSSGANALYPSCGGKPYLDGRVCRRDPGGPASSGFALTTTAFTYDLYGDPLTVTESASGVTRTTTNAYDSAGRLTTTSLVVTGLSTSTAVPASILSYDTTTGEVSTVTGGSAVLSGASDALGRPTTQVDADGNVTSYGYDIDGHVITLNDGKGTATYKYETATEHRGLITSVDTGMGALSTLSGGYDAQGQLVSAIYPNGTTATRTYDSTGFARSLNYALPTYTGGPAAQLLNFTAAPNMYGQTISATSPSSVQAFAFDRAGRLTSVGDTVYGACTSRLYGLSPQSDRTSLSTYGPAQVSGACQQTTPTGTRTSTFDSANRITDAGYSYDQLGRTLTVPAQDAGGAALSMSYFDNDKVSRQVQGSNVKTFTLDPAGRYRQTTDMVGTTEAKRTINHFISGSSDSPSWSAVSTDSGLTWTWDRNVSGFSGLSATQSSTGSVALLLANLHGDVVATIADAVPTAANPAGSYVSSYSETTEFGAQRTAAISRFGWLGSSGRSLDSQGGLVLMGARMYNPATGRFLTRDPVLGGNATDYVYPLNPIDQSDVDGKCSCALIDILTVVALFVPPRGITQRGLEKRVGAGVASLLLAAFIAASACGNYCPNPGQIPRPGSSKNRNTTKYAIYMISFFRGSTWVDVWKYGISMMRTVNARMAVGVRECNRFWDPWYSCSGTVMVVNIPGYTAARAGEYSLIFMYFVANGYCPIGQYYSCK